MNFLKRFAVVALAAVALTACSDDDNGSTATVGGPKIRVVNSAHKVVSPSGAIQPISIDFMVDSVTGASAADVSPAAYDDIPADGISGVNATAAGSATNYFVAPSAVTGFTEFDVGVHSYVAREADSTDGRTRQLYYNNATSPGPYLPRQYLTAGTYYTWVVAGVVPMTVNLTGSTFTFNALVDDPFPPPTLANGTYQARFRVINAAPYSVNTGAGTTMSIWITPGTTAPSGAITDYSSITTASYRNGSAYMNFTAGNYWMTIGTSTGSIRWQGPIILAAGEVRTFVFQNAFASLPFSGSIGTININSAELTNQANYKVTNILDQQY